jgi:hypothetical protein
MDQSHQQRAVIASSGSLPDGDMPKQHHDTS